MSQTTLDPSVDVFEELERLKRERKAVVLAHYYQDPDIQDVADHLGDSLDLAKKARDTADAEVILFCGVHFMAETANILNPSKTTILPDLNAGCSLADAGGRRERRSSGIRRRSCRRARGRGSLGRRWARERRP